PLPSSSADPHKTREKRVILATSSSSAIADEKWDARLSHTPVHDNPYYFKCMLGGVLSCGLTHTAVTPLDVAKCNMQFNPTKYRGLVGSVRTIVAEEGAGMLVKGWLPTLFGYSAQ
ncbi:unnamed protein product, partial [Laminaria digitata]